MRARWALAAAILLALVAYGSLAALATTPRIFYDELLYMEAADSLASGDGLEVRGEEYDRGVLYPVLLAPLLAVAPDREVGYLLAKLLNALLFALTAIPVYLLARRLLPRRHSVVVAGLALAIPSSVYVSVVMTETVSYLAASWAILAIVLAVERPTPVSQGGALLAIGVAFLARPQFAALYPAYLLALAIALWLLPDRRTRLRTSLRGLWPTIASVVLALGLLVVVPALRGDSPFGALGEYETTAQAPDLIEVGQWLVYHVAGLGLYLAVVPFAVAPIVLASWFARARRGSERHASMLASFASVNAAALLIVAYVVGSYERTGLGIDRLHDRYLFYVVPLWLVLLAAWAAEGAPKPRRVATIGAVTALVLTLLLPYGELDIENGVKLFSAVGTAFPAAVVEIAGSALVARFVVLVLAALLLAGVLLRPGRRARLAFAAVLAVFLFNGMLVWARAFNPPEEAVFAGSLERRWVDESVGDGSVAVLSTPCKDGVLARDSLSLTEFFNSSIGPVVEIGGEFPTGQVRRGGQILDEAGRPLEADYAVAQPGVALVGERVADGTNAGLVLWHVGGPVRAPGAVSAEDLTRAACG